MGESVYEVILLLWDVYYIQNRKHRVLKNYLNSSKSLVTLFQVFKELESTEIKNFKDEIRKISKRTEKHIKAQTL